MKHIKCPGSELKLVVAIRKLTEDQALAILCSAYFKIRHFKYQKSDLQARRTWLSLKEILASAQVKNVFPAWL